MSQNTPKGRPEDKISNALRKFMEDRKWKTYKTHGSAYQAGFPDLYCIHKIYGSRWIETKTLRGHLTTSQQRVFPEFTEHNIGIWILTDGTEEEYKKLWQPPNWTYWVFYGVR